MNHYDQLLSSSTGQHGYWLVNHQGIIAGDLMELLNKKGLQQSILIVRDLEDPFTKNIYTKIDASRNKK